MYVISDHGTLKVQFPTGSLEEYPWPKIVDVKTKIAEGNYYAAGLKWPLYGVVPTKFKKDQGPVAPGHKGKVPQLDALNVEYKINGRTGEVYTDEDGGAYAFWPPPGSTLTLKTTKNEGPFEKDGEQKFRAASGDTLTDDYELPGFGQPGPYKLEVANDPLNQ